MIVLIIYKNFIYYLFIKFIVQILQRIVINNYISKEYKNIDFKIKENLDNNSLIKIKTSIKGLVYHKIGDYAVNGTDNIIISYFNDISMVGYYSNYVMITKIIQSVIATFFNSIIPSFGNLLIEKDIEKSLLMFKKIDFLGFTLYSLCSILFINCINEFIIIWIGKNFILSQLTAFLIGYSFFLVGIRMASYAVKSSAGIFKEDSWSPFVQSLINLVVSVVLCKKIGLNGVIIGTIISSFIPIISRVYYIYKIVFKNGLKNYIIKNLLIYQIFFIICSLLSGLICININLIGITKLIIQFIITLVIYIIIFCIFFKKYNEFKYIIYVIKNIFKKINLIFKKNQ